MKLLIVTLEFCLFGYHVIMLVPVKYRCLIFHTEKGYVSVCQRHHNPFSKKLKVKFG